MNRPYLALFVLAAGILVATVFVFISPENIFQSNSAYKTDTDQPTDSVSPDEELHGKIRNLPLRKRIGQLMIFGFATTTPDDHIRKLIQEYGVGGVNLLKRNVASAREVITITGELQRLTEKAGLPPMFIAADQEGGEVNRFLFLSEKTAQGDIGSVKAAFEVAKRRGEELRSLGITMNFSPVLDYVPDSSAYLYDRTFATTAEATAKLGIAMASGYLSAGVIPVFKHFPGYGSVSADPHQNAATILNEAFLEKSLAAFKHALKAEPSIPVMTAHIVYPFFDSAPATLSKKFLSGVLRERFGYEGVIITDDIEMVSARGAQSADVPEIAVQALEAGVDMIISTYTTAFHEKIIKAVEEAVMSGRLSEDRINQSLIRVWKLKELET